MSGCREQSSTAQPLTIEVASSSLDFSGPQISSQPHPPRNCGGFPWIAQPAASVAMPTIGMASSGGSMSPLDFSGPQISSQRAASPMTEAGPTWVSVQPGPGVACAGWSLACPEQPAIAPLRASPGHGFFRGPVLNGALHSNDESGLSLPAHALHSWWQPGNDLRCIPNAFNGGCAPNAVNGGHAPDGARGEEGMKHSSSTSTTTTFQTRKRKLPSSLALVGLPFQGGSRTAKKHQAKRRRLAAAQLQSGNHA